VNRTVFLVDGFNLYHGLMEAGRQAGRTTKWLDLKKLCTAYLPLAGAIGGRPAVLEKVHYFSATPSHCGDDRIKRHRLYMRCLRATGVVVELSRFKRKDAVCRACGRQWVRHEEKETDVAIAVRLFETCHNDEADTIILVTGDTDLAPAVRTCIRLFPEKAIVFAFPPNRINAELSGLVGDSFKIKLRSVLRSQFSDPLVLSDGTELHKPGSW
jgi:hypothetical protein